MIVILLPLSPVLGVSEGDEGPQWRAVRTTLQRSDQLLCLLRMVFVRVAGEESVFVVVVVLMFVRVFVFVCVRVLALLPGRMRTALHGGEREKAGWGMD